MATANETTPSAVPATLTPVISDRYALRWQHAVICGFFALLFVYVSYLPLPYAVLWNDVQRGQQILAAKEIVHLDPSLPLASGMEAVNTSWLSQVVFAGLESWRGAEALSWLLAVATIGSLICFARAGYLMTSSKWLATTAVAVIAVFWWRQLAALGPHTLGIFCFAVMLWLLVRVDPRDEQSRGESNPEEQVPAVPRGYWFALPMLMALWANLDASFLIGVVTMICFVLGQAIRMTSLRGSISAVIGDRRLQSWFWLTEVCAVAVMLHPLGLDLWPQALRISENHFWQSLGGWQPLVLAVWPGLAVAGIWVAAALLLRVSRTPLHPSFALLILAMSVAVICNAQLLPWFAPVAVLFLLSQLGTLLPTHESPAAVDNESSEAADENQPLKFAFTLLCLLLIWTAFALTPISKPILGGDDRTAKQLYSSRTPHQVAQHLREQPTPHLVFAPADWSDWVTWSGPAGTKVFANSNFQQLPAQAQLDYTRVFAGQGNWAKTLDRYRVGTLVIDKQRQATLAESALSVGPEWVVTFEDEQALVLQRKES